MLQESQNSESEIREEATALIKKANPDADTGDTNYIFLSFVINFLPVGLVGLILASILSASMSSTAAELNALASVTVVDIYKRVFKKSASDHHYLIASKLATVFWGIYAINSALFANRLGLLGALIEAVNILGSFFYGTLLGIFIIAFFFKNIGGNATFIAAILAELIVVSCFFFTEIPYLWYNVIGCVVLIILAHMINPLFVAIDNNRT
jgi:Na+/proline symporter